MPQRDIEYIHRVLDGALGMLYQQEAHNPKKVEETKRKIDELYTALKDGSVTVETQSRLMTLSQAIENRDAQTAVRMQQEISSSSEWTQHKSWMMVLKRVIPK